MGISSATYAQMSSRSYTITSSVITGGGTPTQSSAAGYKMTGTIGQATAQILESNPTSADPKGMELKLGFWNTVCPQDRDGDNRVDGLDLERLRAALASDPDLDVMSFAGSYGRPCL